MVGPNPWIMLPFALLLVSMALAPSLAPQWWLRHYAKISFGLGAVALGYYLFVLQDMPRVLHTAHDYAGFIALVGSLFIVSGGIHLGFEGRGTPLGNAVFLLAGAVLANILGTTGAAMLLIRPWIRVNRGRLRPYHVAFFIFLVANVGGCLTPIGDPPLFLGFLQGVPFWWVARNCWPMWAVATGMLLAIFYAVDRFHFVRVPGNEAEPGAGRRSWQINGLPNLFFLAVILGAVFVVRPVFLREALMIAAAAGSYLTTPKAVHQANRFDFHPVREVAVLFAGIFATMMPVLEWLNDHARGVLGGNPSAGIFFWGTGGLSAVLDNAPTYLAFLGALRGVTGVGDIAQLLGQASGALGMVAISVGAVFFGAATYIGNGPNFMVKAIAEAEGVPMPGFSAFVLKFTLPFLLPVLLTVWLLFFRG